MSKRVLLIESDTAHAREIYKALEAYGVEVRVTGDGKEGLELARDERPDAIVLCVELPRVSGYSVCQKLKKDGNLKDIPVVLISAEATLETFEQHRKLKGRAEEYLLKPFPPRALIVKLAPILGFDPAPRAAPAAAESELISLADVEFEATGSRLLDGNQLLEDGNNPLAGGDDDLKFLDDAFDRLSAGSEPEAPPEAEVEIGLDLPPDGGLEVPLETEVALERSAPAEVALGLAGEVAATLEPLPEVAAALQPPPEAAVAAPAMNGHLADGELARLARALADSEDARRDLEERLARAEERVLRAVTRLQHDEEAREKARKALAIALQLIGSGPVQTPSGDEATFAPSAAGSTPR